MSSHQEGTVAHVHRDDVGAKMGMWLFLFTEVLLFGGMFLVYACYPFQHRHQFLVEAMDLILVLKTIESVN